MKHRRLKNMRYSFVSLLVIFFFASGRAPAEEPLRAPEVRAIWVTRWDYRSAADVRTILGNCRSLGLNRVYFQVRGRSDAFYRSNLEPWAEELGGRDPGFDPLAVAIAEARKQDLELHAWANVLAGWKGRSPATYFRCFELTMTAQTVLSVTARWDPRLPHRCKRLSGLWQ